MELNSIILGDSLEVLKTFPDESVHCCVTSPPFWGLRDYGHNGQYGLEKTPEEYVAKMVLVFNEVRRVLKDDGTLWLNLGDTYWGGKGQSGRLDHNLEQRVAEGRSLARREYTLDMDKCPQDGKHEFIKPKDLCGIPWRVAFALQKDGWYLRQDIIWHKPNPMPESVTDRCTKSHEYIFLMSKSPKYYFDANAIKEKATSFDSDGRPPGVVRDREYDYDSKQKAMGRHKNTVDKGFGVNTMHLKREQGIKDPTYVFRNKRSVWTVTTKPYKGAHFATFPEDLIRPCILAGCPKGGIVLDPFSGAGTTALVAKKEGRNFIGIELNPKYVKMSENRIDSIMF